ncbi:MAG: oxidoreductase [Crocinitomicaceae bacterium]|nr:oxidoreductase [Crocinitomicaceae bacterium]
MRLITTILPWFFTIFFVQAFHAQTTTLLEFKSSVRALDVLNEETIAFSGYGGLIGISRDGGESWDTTRVEFEGKKPAFRACGIMNKHLYIVSIESPGLIFKIPTDDLSIQKLVYRNDDKDVFLDALEFTEDGLAIVMGDPTNGCMTVLMGFNDGETWKRIPCNRMPKNHDGEAAFAASNGNIAIVGDEVWFATGGKSSRVFKSEYRGFDWTANKTPITQGGQMTGIFAISFKDGNTGIAIGGNWEEMENNKGNLAITRDGGKSWKLISEGKGPGYRSSIVWQPTQPETCVAIGSEGIDISHDEGATWTRLSNEGFYTGRFSPSGSRLYLAGSKRLSKIDFK